MHDSTNHLDGYCLTYYSRDDKDCTPFCPDIYTEQIMSYCYRPAEQYDQLVISDIQYISNLNITFAQLRQKSITSAMLLSWSASIDIAERYQIFLNNYSDSSSENDVVFHNCTPSWFGPSCHFTIDYPIKGPFDSIVERILIVYRSGYEIPQMTCYIHIPFCQTSLPCLDWREICDGKADCVNGADESNCWELEINECNEDEYRCSNGQCIPWDYYTDTIEESTECLDRTDQAPFSNKDCYRNPKFKCEEHGCPPGSEEFPCGDGQCVNNVFKCTNGRYRFVTQNFCTNAMFCFLKLYEEVNEEWCKLFCAEGHCIRSNCSMGYELNSLPLLFGHVRLMVLTETISSNRSPLPNHICYNATLCPHFPSPTAFSHHWACHHLNDFGLRYTNYTQLKELVSVIKSLFQGCLSANHEQYDCSLSSMYQCINSTKCISKHRLLDSIEQCPFGDDETYNQSCSINDIRQRFQCKDDNHLNCFTFLAMKLEKKVCRRHQDPYETTSVFEKSLISFPLICDGFDDIPPLLIDGQYETDETGCEPWECNNTYSRCDGIWSCKNGADEVDCHPSSCPIHHHRCIFPNDTSTLSCLPIERAGNDIDDCVGGTDEWTKNRIVNRGSYYDTAVYTFRCRNDMTLITTGRLCNNEKDCPLNDDETLCKDWTIASEGLCWISEDSQTDLGKFLCQLDRAILRDFITSFKLRNVLTYPLELVTNNAPILPPIRLELLARAEDQSRDLSYSPYSHCNRGIPVRSLTIGNASRVSCLCPPSYYGNACQYQNQRVSLTVRIQLTSDWRNIFIFLITLIDTQANIESYEYLEYIHTRDCPIKYNIYLIYANRPKNSSKIYSARIDVFIGMALKYRSTWIFPLRFSFLPVYRLPVILKIPFSIPVLMEQKCSPSCIHGQCLPYVNNQNSTFCQCDSGWSGVQCEVKLRCDCAVDAICISHSICLCPPGRFGRRCHLSYFANHSQSCMNGGNRVPIDARYVPVSEKSSICICPEGYIGDSCEYRQGQTKIGISFHHTITIPPSLLVHLLAVRDLENLSPNRTSIAKKLQFDQSSLTMYTTKLFNIAIAQMLGQYYLIVLSERPIYLTHITTEVIPDHRCRSLAELFDHTFTGQHLLKRIKFYHRPCKQDPKLICFYDDVQICLCTLDRSANCLDFDQNMTYECEKAKYCGDRGQCFQDDHKCPASSFCACDRCYFGSRCQFSTKGSTLSLDIILGYHIRLKNSLHHQPIIVKMAIVFTAIIFALGMINGILSFLTFRRKETRNVGCGMYLLTTSIASMITVMILVLKFVILVVIQTGSIHHHHRFLYVQCVSIDFVLRSLLSMIDWLNACVAIERAISVLQGVNFSKKKSQHVARWVIIIVVLLTGCSYIYDPVHRRVMNDEEDQQIWCVTQHSSSVQVLDSIMNTLHFCIPFVINGISALIVIITITRRRLTAQKTKSFKEHLHEQLHHHKHLIISPLILVILGIPRLVISFLSGCMGSARESWLYLLGYYISFIPPILTLFVFILPSKLYREQFRKILSMKSS